MMIYIFIFLSFFLQTSHSGYITPSRSDASIVNTVTNANQYANYTFYFILDTAIPAGSRLSITFPQQFSSNLGIDILTATTCSVTCTISSYVASFTFPNGLSNGVENSATITNVLNPLSSGGTGNFQLSTSYNTYVFDENKIFGKLAIAPQPGTLTACYLLITNQSQAVAGQTTEYRLSFKTISAIPYQSFMLLTLPLGVQLGFPSNMNCSTFTINTMNLNVPITCTTLANTITFTGLTTDIPLGFEVGLKFNLINPPFAGSTGTFIFQIFRMNTQFIYDARNDVPAITIQPGNIGNVTLTPVNTASILSLSKIVTYQLVFSTPNPIPAGGMISITFPSTFPLVYDTEIDYIYLGTGIIDFNSTSPAGYSYDSSSLYISSFQTILPGTLITIQFNAINPSVSGVSSALQIMTYMSSGSQIDQNLNSAFITVQNIRSSLTIFPNGIGMSNSNANSNLNTLTFTITPSIDIPPSGYISIKIPSAFTVSSPTASACLVDISGTHSQTCTSPTANTILVQLPVTTTYYLGVQNTLTLTGIVQNPSLNGTFLFDINTYYTDGLTLLDSFSDYVILSGALLTTASGYLIGSTVSQPTGYANNIYSILVIKFTLQNNLPAANGMIQIAIYPPWDFDLGTGLSDNSMIPCQAISNIVNIVCVLNIGNLNSPTTITITGFSTVTSGSAVEIHFPNLRNPLSSSATNFDIYLITITNRIYYVLNYNTISISASSAATLMSTKAYTFTPTPNPVLVSSSFSLTYLPKLTATIPAGGYILVEFPIYDVGFFTSATNVICTVQTTVCTCTLYPSVQWILIKITTTITPTGTTPTITLQNLVWPQIVYNPSSYGLITRTLTAGTYADVDFIYSSNYIPQSAQSYSTASVNANRPLYNAVGVLYTFTFQAQNNIAANSDIYIVFPSIYNLLSTPEPWLIPLTLPSYSQFSIVDLITAKISSVGAIAMTSTFSFTIAGVKNPGFGSASTGWNIQAKINGNSSNSYSTFTVLFTLAGLFAPATITVNSLTAFPSNMGLNAIYSFDFVTNIPYIVYPSVEIYLIFPSSNYQILPTIPSCNVSYGMNYYSSIALAGSSFLIITSQSMSITSQRIQFMIKNVMNPSTNGLTDSFSILFIYDGTIIAQTDSTVTYSIVITSSPNIINIASFSLQPLNEGESTTMEMEFSLTDQLDSTMMIKLIFPSVYDSKLTSDTLSCVGIQSINEELNCWADDAILSINGIFSSSLASNTIIQITNIINPNYILNSNTGYIALATQIITDTQYLDYISTAGFFTLVSAPNYCLISSIALSNLYSRLDTTYTFNLTFYTSIPTALALGAIIIEFPSEYDIPDNSALSCSVVSATYGTPSCSISNNIAAMSGNNVEFSGNLLVILNNIKNPTNVGSIGQFFIYSYNGYNSEILERSYSNLGTFSFSFVLKGAEVVVNEDLPLTIQVGTQSALVDISIQNPSILNLTFKPTVAGLTLIPSSLILYAGTIITNFRISVPETYTIGTYSILWETINDANLLFTPLKDTIVNVVDNAQVSISFSPIYDLPVGGQSLPITFSLPNPPNSQVEVDITFSNSSLIKASPSSLVFTSGVTSLSTIFTPTVLASTASSVTALFSLSGVSSSNYVLASSSHTINLLSGDLVLPAFMSVSLTEITRTYVTMSISTNKAVVAYYMIALAGTNIPIFEEVSQSGPPASLTTQSVYGQYVVQLTGTVTLDGLLAENNYTLYIYIQDQLMRTAGPETLTFQTLDNYRPAEFSIMVDKVNPTPNEITWVIENIAYYLAINVTNIEQRVYNLGLLPNQTIDTSQQTILYFYMIAMPFNTIMPTPLILANSIQSQLVNISTQYPTIDTSYTILTAEFPASIPNILYLSNITNATYTSLSFTINLDNYGKVFALAMPLISTTTTSNSSNTTSSSSSATSNSSSTNNTNSTKNNSNTTSSRSGNTTVIVNNSLLPPTSFQIYMGLDRTNLNSDTVSQYLEISQKNTNFSFVFTGLNQNTSYVVFITVGNVHPYVPDLEDSSKISTLFGTTLIAPIIIITTIFAVKLEIGSLLTIIIFFILIMKDLIG